MGSYGNPGWGYGMGYGGGMAIPYDYTVTSLTGIAIRYTNNEQTKC